MKIFITSLAVFISLNVSAQQDYSIKAVDFTQVKLNDMFWLPRIETNRTVTIPASFERCETTGRVKNFDMAAKASGKFCTTFPFDDTDIYKTIEGASFSLAVHPDAKLSSYIDSLITIIGKAQEPDGYLYTARTINPAKPHSWSGPERWVKERELSHELYNSGHLYEAAAAHFQATGKRNLLNIALKNAELVCSVFGPGKRSVAPGHEIVEMGLVKLYRITGNKNYLNTAKFFIEARGKYTGYDTKSNDSWTNGAYWQDNKPVKLQDEAVGHAVRAGYLYSAVADVAALTGDDSLKNAIDKIWENVVSKKIYVQGSIGARGDGERFGNNYELPNNNAYNETCAAISNVYWNQRMFFLHGDSKYIDVLEKTLYNGLISGIGLDGKSFFYTNAMQIVKATNKQTKNGFTEEHAEVTRSGWFDCSCCPTNLTRLLPSVPGYMYAQKQNNIYINLFVKSTASIMNGKNKISITQDHAYPWKGDLHFRVDPATTSTFTIQVRIPGWARNEAIPSSLYSYADKMQGTVVIKINGTPVKFKTEKGFAILNRTWKKGDQIDMILPMETRKVVTENTVPENKGLIALQQGPIMYCAEWADNDSSTSNIIIPADATFTTSFKPSLLNGVNVIQTNVWKTEGNTKQLKPFVGIPYYAWANRGKGEMSLWMKEQQ